MKKEEKITIKDVEHIAELSRVYLRQEEKEKFKKELSDILNYVEELNEVDISNVEPTFHAIGLVNVFRDDEAEEKGAEREERANKILDSAPAQKDGYFKVKSILQND